MRSAIAILLAALLAVVTGGAAGGEVYRWVDEDGTVHYSDDHPGPDRTYEELEIAPEPDPEEVQRALEREHRLSEELAHHADSRELQAQEAEQLARQREFQEIQRRENCKRAQQNLHTLLMKRPVYTIDENGERVYLDDARHRAAIQGMRRSVLNYCDSAG